ncbi:TPA: PD-(D/E)XK nuclease-like domain-containing protein [Enterobacter cloacae subsp. cloacae]|uniref:RecE family exodeoxyribonuclease n=1 Tax=Enterobacter cloacae TaxID=550 RepID=UPI00076D8E1D|nr:RecE family exodeoxyribonuclease [Enterobacter cloacae]KVJ40872.1 exodeoxyribonuclease [Enterobacter cloacae subsp. cloacae]PAN87832.1 exodeoxyribonuclease [Enterobacter cloacae]HAV2192630.1 exodeoxyribonuclease [Enterobacter cloacae]HCM9269036.1 PD-(D/E)XK nuclease-like domain-containing protein [Enterobacter cloacae subsp. cloacae]HCM9540660.1 PD-(D/E)XK nuclease-like domain-containing protein [Enterobacter cloacae subsp. cloacae]
MEFFYVVKATQKSGKEDAVIWFTAKSEARANLQLDVELEDAGIETGRGKDYAKPVRTDFPVYNDLPKESTVDYTWCKRYKLQDDGRTWLPKAGAESTGAMDNTAASETSVNVENSVESVPLENRTPAVRFAVHLTNDKYQSYISKEQQLAASKMSLDEGNTYLQNLLLAKNDIPEVAELSLNAEWKLVQAIKQVFAPDEAHETEIIAAFMADWARADASDRNQLIEEWRSGKLNLLKSESASETGVTTDQVLEPDNGIQIDENDDETTRYPVVRMPFRKQLLAQFSDDILRHHLTREEYEGISALEMDTDNSYVQNLLLAAENCEEVKGYDTKDLWRYTDAIRKVFSQEKRHELALVLRFTRVWAATDYIDRGILVREWANGNRISNVQRTDSGTNADGGHVTDRGEGAHHTLDTLDLEIACALLPMDFHHFEIPSSVLRRAKEIVAKKEEPWKSWSAILRNQPGILAVNRAAIFNLIRIAPENIHHTPAAHLEFVNKTMTAEFNSAVELLPLPTPAVKTEVSVEQPQVENLGGGVFSIDGLTDGNTEPVINTNSNEVEKTENAAETTSDVLMETAKPEKVENTDPVQPGEGTDAADTQAVTVEQEEQKAEPVIEFPAYFEPGRYEGLPNDVYHAANGLSSTQIKDARVSLMYFNVRHVAKTISQHDNPAFIFGRATHSFVLEPEKFSDNYVLPEKMPEGVVSTTGEMVAIIKEYNATLPALMTPDELKAWIEEYNGNLTPPLSLSAGAEETANSYMSLPEEFQRIPAETKPTATAMKACIKEYNASLKPMLKTSGTRDQLLDQIATVAPEFAEQERAKFIPYNVSGTKEQLSEIVRTIRPDVVFADDWHAQQEAANAGKETISVEMYELIKNINDALQSNNDASRLLNHPARQSEVSYFGFDEETGLEVRVRPDIEIRLPYESICADLKTVSLGYVRQDKLKDRLHREIIDRDYHLSAAMYCDVAGLDKFTWIFVNKDPGYHWVAVVDASPMLLELGRKEYRRALRQIEEAMETGYWPAPISEAYTDDLNDYDTRRLEALDAE